MNKNQNANSDHAGMERADRLLKEVLRREADRVPEDMVARSREDCLAAIRAECQRWTQPNVWLPAVAWASSVAIALVVTYLVVSRNERTEIVVRPGPDSLRQSAQQNPTPIVATVPTETVQPLRVLRVPPPPRVASAPQLIVQVPPLPRIEIPPHPKVQPPPRPLAQMAPLPVVEVPPRPEVPAPPRPVLRVPPLPRVSLPSRET